MKYERAGTKASRPQPFGSDQTEHRRRQSARSLAVLRNTLKGCRCSSGLAVAWKRFVGGCLNEVGATAGSWRRTHAIEGNWDLAKVAGRAVLRTRRMAERALQEEAELVRCINALLSKVEGEVRRAAAAEARADKRKRANEASAARAVQRVIASERKRGPAHLLPDKS